MNKETLETNKAALTLLASETNEKLVDYKAQVSVIEQQLEDLGKPEVTPAFLDKIFETINKAIENINLDDGVTCDFEIDYDSRVAMSNVCFEDTHGVTELIYNEVAELFAETEEKEDK